MRGADIHRDESLQLFSPLSTAEYDALKGDIQARGILIPVEVDQDGRLIDGFHRAQIAEELGIVAPIVERHFDDDAQRLAHVIALNLKRRHLDPVTWGEFFMRYAEARGVELGKTGPKPRDGISDTVSLIAAELGVHKRTAERRLAAARLPEPYKEQLRAGDRTLRTATQEVKRQARKDAAAGREAEGRRAPPTPATKYQTIVVDPPWQYERDDIRGAAEHHYDTMTFDQIAAYPVGDMAADNCHLYLWVTNPHLPYVWRIIEAWGFDYKTMLTWVKPQMGTGHYFRGATEHVLFCTRGNLPLRDDGIRNWFEADRTEHSDKPDAFYALVERASFGPYLELFARRWREGWVVFGDEV